MRLKDRKIKMIFKEKSINIKIQIRVFLFKEGDYYTYCAHAISVSGYGKTKKDAKKSFIYNLKLFSKEIREYLKK